MMHMEHWFRKRIRVFSQRVPLSQGDLSTFPSDICLQSYGIFVFKSMGYLSEKVF